MQRANQATHVSQLTNNPTQSPHGNQAPLPLIREAFSHLRNAYGDNFAPTKRRPKEDDKHYQQRVHHALDTWAAALGHLSAAEIRVGVTRCIREVRFGDRVTPADIVSRAALEPEDMGLPPARAAFLEALRNMLSDEHNRRWSHGAVFFAARDVSTRSSEWRAQTEQALWQHFERSYSICCRRHMLGESMEAPMPKALPAKQKTWTPNWQRQREHLAKVREVMARGSKNARR